MSYLDFLFFALMFALVVYVAYNRHFLRDYKHASSDLPAGVLMLSYCRGTTMIQIVSDGKGFSKPVKFLKSPQCGMSGLK